MNGTTAVCEFTPDVRAEGAISGELSESDERPRRAEFPRVIEGVSVTFEDADEEFPGGGERLVYRVIPQQPGIDGRVYVTGFRAESWQLHSAAQANTTTSSGWLRVGTQSDVDPNTWRGVFAIRHRTRVLFSDRVRLDLRSLPKGRPHITITRRMLEANDE